MRRDGKFGGSRGPGFMAAFAGNGSSRQILVFCAMDEIDEVSRMTAGFLCMAAVRVKCVAMARLEARRACRGTSMLPGELRLRLADYGDDAMDEFTRLTGRPFRRRPFAGRAMAWIKGGRSAAQGRRVA